MECVVSARGGDGVSVWFQREVVIDVCGEDLTAEQLSALGEAAVFADGAKLRNLGRGMNKDKARELAQGLKDMPKGRQAAAAFQLVLEVSGQDRRYF
jgi:hypothetical protein